ncbi:DNA ligase 4-like [Lotus japonicus]|uniref:DNA ligase 4-like n=1 Tax=Lotus japonicus TaxID=34305 RepID=UPI00258435F3|nr:DNA ligase 4-like [Lotus japonicus]
MFIPNRVKFCLEFFLLLEKFMDDNYYPSFSSSGFVSWGSCTSVERRILRSKRLHIVKSQWLEDCLNSSQRLPEDAYSLRPDGIEESTTEDCEYDLALDTHLVGDNVEDQNTSFSDLESKHRTAKAAHEPSLASVSQEKGSGRKRGRPAGRGTKNVKTAGNQAPRGRARKRGKICEYESDDDRDSQQIRPQGQDTREGGLDFNEKHLEPHETKKPENVQATETVESSQQNEAFKPEDSKERECERMFVPEIEMTDRHNGHNSQVSEKLEFLADPVQAMLFKLLQGFDSSIFKFSYFIFKLSTIRIMK